MSEILSSFFHLKSQTSFSILKKLCHKLLDNHLVQGSQKAFPIFFLHKTCHCSFTLCDCKSEANFP